MLVNISYMFSWCLAILGEFPHQLTIVGSFEEVWVPPGYNHNVWNIETTVTCATMYNSWAQQVSISSFPSLGWAVEKHGGRTAGFFDARGRLQLWSQWSQVPGSLDGTEQDLLGKVSSCCTIWKQLFKYVNIIETSWNNLLEQTLQGYWPLQLLRNKPVLVKSLTIFPLSGS